MGKLTIKKQKDIEHTFMLRMQEFGYKSNGMSYYAAQADFFIGAMSATENVALWTICIKESKSIYEERNKVK